MLVASDFVAVSLAWLVTCVIGLQYADTTLFSRSRLGFYPVIVAITMAVIASNRLYLARQCSVRAVETATLMRACAVAGVTSWVVAGRFNADRLRIRMVVVAEVLAFLFVILGRSMYRSALRRARRSGRFTRPVLIVGTGDEAYELQRLLVDEPELGYSVLGVVGRSHEAAERPFSVPFLGSTKNTVDLVRAHGATGVIVGASSLSFRELNQVVRSLLDADVHVQVSGGLLGFNSSRLRANPIGREAAFYLEQAQLSGWQANVKRALDLALGSVSIVLFAPVIALFAVLVRRDGGPAFFVQQRIGRDEKPFRIYKLRTMVVNAEAQLADLAKENERTGPLFKMKNDPRLTRIGRIMDATSINELPQLWNVLKGEMSLVGPRPALAKEVAKFNDRLLVRHRVKPGITGLWQVESRDDPSFADYERCDVFYVENWSVRLDLMILAQTVGEVVKRGIGRSENSDPSALDGDVSSPTPLALVPRG